MFALITLAPVKLPPPPVPVDIVPVTTKLPDTFATPLIFAPVPVTTNILALPTALMLTLPLAAGIFTLLFPFACTPIKLPTVALPDTDSDASVPVLVIFGCAFVVTVPAVVAAPLNVPTNVVAPMLPTLALPDTLNVPVMFAPVPVITRTFALPVTPTVTLPLADGIFTLLLPFTIAVALPTPVSKLPLPIK